MQAAAGGEAAANGQGVALRTFLVGIILLATVPIALLMSYQILSGAKAQEQRLQDRLQQASRAVAHVVNRELSASVEALKLVAREPGLRGDGAALLRGMVREDAALFPGWSSVYLKDGSGALLFDSRPGAPMPQAAGTLPAVVHAHAPGGARATVVEVRVAMPQGQARVLGARIAAGHWQRLLESAMPGSADDLRLLDGDHQPIARTAAASGEGTYSAWAPVPMAGWSVGVAVRSEPVVAAQRRAVITALSTAGGCLLVGVSLALLAARRVTTPLRQLASGRPQVAGEDDIREIALLRHALLAAQQQDRQSRERLQSKADEFETLFNSSPVALAFALDPRCENVLHNSAMSGLLGEHAAPEAGAVRVLRRGRELARDDQPLQHAARSGEPVPATELEIRLGEQRSAFVLAQAVPLRAPGGKPRGAISAFMDITERKLAEARLLSADQRLHEKQHLIDLAQEAGRVGFFHYQFDSDVLAWTPGQAKLFGIDTRRTDVTLGDWERRVDPEDRVEIERVLRGMLAHGAEKETLEFRVLPEAGAGPRWLSARVLTTYGADGHPLQLIGVTMDTTDQKAAERERAALVRREQAARREAEEANRAKDEFLAMLGHELRNPLSAIASAVEVLNRSDPAAEVAVRARTIIARQTRHLAHMVDDLLDVTRVISGKVLLSRSRVDLEALVRRVATTQEVTGALRQHELKLELQEAWIDADITRIEQVINNLLTNALKYTPAGGHIVVTLQREGEQAVLRVSDDGFGIPPELLPRIFDLFVQGERTLERRGGGLGIGLTLVRRLVELQGGSITAASTGAGSSFELRFPALERPGDAAPARSAAASLRPRRIAVIEDNDDALQALQSLLELDGHDVVTAVDGVSGLDAVLRQRPDVAVVDIGLPGLTGFEVARRSRAAGYTGRLIALSGYGLEQDVGQAMEAGFDAHLVKPVDAGELRRLLVEA